MGLDVVQEPSWDEGLAVDETLYLYYSAASCGVIGAEMTVVCASFGSTFRASALRVGEDTSKLFCHHAAILEPPQGVWGLRSNHTIP